MEGKLNGLDLTTGTGRHCLHCGTSLKRKNITGKSPETLWNFRHRKYCDRVCAGFRKRKLTRHGYGFRARKFLKPKCEACGYDKKLQAHHIDQDRTNNCSVNIQTLCKSCHDYWHTAGRRAGLNVAGKMPYLYQNASG